jgi:hypothetical protein
MPSAGGGDGWTLAHTGIAEDYPPGDVMSYVTTQSYLHHMNIVFTDTPPDFDKTGPAGINFLYYYGTTVFTLTCRILVQCFVGGSNETGVAVTTQKAWGINLGLQAAQLQFDETEITANWDGSKGYLTKAQMDDLNAHVDWQHGIPGDIGPPNWED